MENLNFILVGPDPQPIICPQCHQQVLTIVQYSATTRTHIVALILCLFGCWLCVCLPYCMDSCKNANHYCPQCNGFIGSYTR